MSSVRTAKLVVRQVLPYSAFTKRSRNISLHAKRNDRMVHTLPSEYAIEVRRVLELAERSLDTWEVLHSPFLPPPALLECVARLKRMSEVQFITWGGYDQAERCRITVGREETLLEPTIQSPASIGQVAAVAVKGNFLFDPASHRDFLGAALGTGIERSVLGDILVQGDVGAQLLCTPSIVEHLEVALTQVRTVPVVCKRVDLNELRVPEARVKEIESVESSLRLDAIGSAGFRISRAKLAEVIRSGDLKLNWKVCQKPSINVSPGDLISFPGKGRVEVCSINETKKGKFSVIMKRYL